MDTRHYLTDGPLDGIVLEDDHLLAVIIEDNFGRVTAYVRQGDERLRAVEYASGDGESLMDVRELVFQSYVEVPSRFWQAAEKHLGKD
jgi:hypothetical protein